MITTIDVLSAISDERSLLLFKTIARFNSEGSTSEILINTLHLRSKQYYSRMSRLIQAGLVKRQKGRYLLTAFGKVIYGAQMNLETKIENALDNYWKLKAIDSLEMPSREEIEKVISALIEDEEIKSVLMKEESQLSEEVTKKSGDTLLTVQNYL